MSAVGGKPAASEIAAWVIEARKRQRRTWRDGARAYKDGVKASIFNFQHILIYLVSSNRKIED